MTPSFGPRTPQTTSQSTNAASSWKTRQRMKLGHRSHTRRRAPPPRWTCVRGRAPRIAAPSGRCHARRLPHTALNHPSRTPPPPPPDAPHRHLAPLPGTPGTTGAPRPRKSEPSCSNAFTWQAPDPRGRRVKEIVRLSNPEQTGPVASRGPVGLFKALGRQTLGAEPPGGATPSTAQVIYRSRAFPGRQQPAAPLGPNATPGKTATAVATQQEGTSCASPWNRTTAAPLRSLSFLPVLSATTLPGRQRQGHLWPAVCGPGEQVTHRSCQLQRCGLGPLPPPPKPRAHHTSSPSQKATTGAAACPAQTEAPNGTQGRLGCSASRHGPPPHPPRPPGQRLRPEPGQRVLSANHGPGPCQRHTLRL